MTSIEWTDATWNPVRGCSRVSEGCRNCYAERMAVRMSGPGQWGESFADAPRRHPQTGAATTGVRGHWTGKVELIPSKLAEPLSWRKPRKVFVNSMSDLFHEGLGYMDVAAVFGIMACSPKHTFQILTKRPEMMSRFFEAVGDAPYLARFAMTQALTRARVDFPRALQLPLEWPLHNVWLGVSVEDQATADERIPLLLKTPAATRFVSYEPALGPVDFSPYWLGGACWACGAYKAQCECGETARLSRLDWVIVGGESGPGARPFNVSWPRSTVSQCRAAKVPVFVKQLGANVRDRNDAGFDGHCQISWPAAIDEQDRVEEIETGHQGAEVRIHLASSKGGDPAEWPRDLRIRQFPEARA